MEILNKGVSKQISSGTPVRQGVRLFYQGSRLATEMGGLGNRSVMRAQETTLAHCSDTELKLLQTDQPGSVLGVQNAALVAIAYSPYGHYVADQSSTLLGFNGQRYDPVTGGYLLGNGHRLHSPTLMRFVCADFLSPFGKGGMNAYAYCAGDPVNRSDPSGRIATPWFKSLRSHRPAPGIAKRSGPQTFGNGKYIDHSRSVTKRTLIIESEAAAANMPIGGALVKARPTLEVAPTSRGGPTIDSLPARARAFERGIDLDQNLPRASQAVSEQQVEIMPNQQVAIEAERVRQQDNHIALLASQGQWW